MREKIIFSLLWCLIQKLDHNSGLHAKNQREISKNEVRKPPPLHPLYGNVDIPLYRVYNKCSKDIRMLFYHPAYYMYCLRSLLVSKSISFFVHYTVVVKYIITIKTNN